MEQLPSELKVGTIVTQQWKNEGRSGQNRLIKVANDHHQPKARPISYWGFVDRMECVPSEDEFTRNLQNDRYTEHTFAIWDNSSDHKDILSIETPES